MRIEELPHGENETFYDTSFFKIERASFPSPAEVRLRRTQDGYDQPSVTRPLPVRYPNQRLLVKYGSDITLAEGQCLWFMEGRLGDRVSVPEIYGWRRDGEETFLYMELLGGETLEARWEDLSVGERTDVCRQLRGIVDSWRELRQESEPFFLGMRFYHYPSSFHSMAFKRLFASQCDPSIH